MCAAHQKEKWLTGPHPTGWAENSYPPSGDRQADNSNLACQDDNYGCDHKASQDEQALFSTRPEFKENFPLKSKSLSRPLLPNIFLVISVAEKLGDNQFGQSYIYYTGCHSALPDS